MSNRVLELKIARWELANLAKEIESSGLAAGLAGFDEKEFASLLEGPEPVDDTDA